MTPDWQSSLKIVKDRSICLFETMKLSDCSFLVGSEHNRKTFKAHRLMLSMASPVFEMMFYGHLAEKDYPITIPDVEPEAFHILLEYIYTDRIGIGTFEEATALCYAAQKYLLQHVVDYCIQFVTSNLNVKNACRGWEFGKLFDKTNLMKTSMQLIMNKTTEILAETGFNEIETCTLMEILDQDHLNINSELELFNAVERYANVNGRISIEDENDDCLLRKAIRKIRFLVLTPQQFAEGPAGSKLLHHNEKYAILMNISSGRVKDCPMPEGFSISKNCRTRKQKHYTIDPMAPKIQFIRQYPNRIGSDPRKMQMFFE